MVADELKKVVLSRSAVTRLLTAARSQRAEEGGFFCYACGVAYEMVVKYHVLARQAQCGAVSRRSDARK